MTCRYCEKDPKSFMLIPEGLQEVDVNQSPFACLDCAIKEGIFCAKHNRAHQSFGPGKGKHACWGCVGEAREHLMQHSEQALGLVLKLLERLPKDLQEQFFEEGALDIALIGRSKTRICIEFLARAIAVAKLDPDEFIDRYFFDEIGPESWTKLMAMHPQ